MIRVAPVGEPAEYHQTKRTGDAWLDANPTRKRPQDLWSPYLAHLANGFGGLCGYAAMLDPTGGTVDHYLSWKNYRHLAYEWSNFRHVSSILNSSKRNADDAVLDPYDVRDGWFEISLPSLQMQLSDKVPSSHRAKAEYTLARLKLRDGEKVLRWRQHWYACYLAGDLTLDGLRAWAPLIAEAVERGVASALPAKRAVQSEPTAKSAAKSARAKAPAAGVTTRRAATKRTGTATKPTTRAAKPATPKRATSKRAAPKR